MNGSPRTGAGNRPARRSAPSGVLTGSEIRDLGIIAENFTESCLKPTSYDLRLGDEFKLPSKHDGTTQLLNNSDLTIPKFSSVIVSTYEIVKIPGNVTGKFNLKIKMALRGLFVQMGTQVEPNYYGRLFALLQNVSDEDIVISPRSDQHKLFAIEFYYTSAVIPRDQSDFGQREFTRISDFVGKAGSFSGTINNITTAMKESISDLEATNKKLELDVADLSRRLNDAMPQITQATERLFTFKTAFVGVLYMAFLGILVSVAAPMVAKLIFELKEPLRAEKVAPAQLVPEASETPTPSLRQLPDRLPAKVPQRSTQSSQESSNPAAPLEADVKESSR